MATQMIALVVFLFLAESRLNCPPDLPTHITSQAWSSIGQLAAQGRIEELNERWTALSRWEPKCGVDLFSGDKLFNAGKYREAFAAYSDEFFQGSGGSGRSTILNPSSYDSGASEFLESGLDLAAKGQYSQAAVKFHTANKADPYLVEGRYFLGEVLFALKQWTPAADEWRLAIRNYGYAVPEQWEPPLASVAALEMYLYHESLHK